MFTQVTQVLISHSGPESQELLELLKQIPAENRERWLSTCHRDLSWRAPGNRIIIPDMPEVHEVLTLLKQNFIFLVPPTEDTSEQPETGETLAVAQEEQDKPPVALLLNPRKTAFPLLRLRRKNVATKIVRQ